MVLPRLIYDGASLGEPYVLIVNLRFGSMALVAALFFAAGGIYRHKFGKAVLDPLFGIVANAVLLTAISFEIHSGS
jgi:hypothetical protein